VTTRVVKYTRVLYCYR